MDFISQYVKAREGTVVPKEFTLWSGMFLLMLGAENRVWIPKDHFEIYPTIHFALVGGSGSKKTTAIRAARKLWKEVHDNYPTGPSIASREFLVELMASPVIPSEYIDYTGEKIRYTPFVIWPNELENFLSFSPQAMIQWLTDMYGELLFDSGTIKRGIEKIIRPCLNILGAMVPSYMEWLLKYEGITNGILRRFLFIYVVEPPGGWPRCFDPKWSPESRIAHEWCVAHLKKVCKLTGPFSWTPEAREFMNDWDSKIYTPDDMRIFGGYFTTKDVLAQQLAMLVALAQPEPALKLTLPVVQRAVQLLESNEVNISKMVAMAGKNPLLGTRIKLMEFLTGKGGIVPEHIFHRMASIDMNERDYDDMLRMLQNTKQIIVQPYLHGQNYVFLPGAYIAMREKNEAKTKPVFQPSL